MGQFEPAITITLKWEDPSLGGTVTKDPTRNDPNAVARFGINSASHPKAVDDGFYTMEHTKALVYASDVYKYEYFSPIGGYQIKDQWITNKFFDLAVNEGIYEATKIIQRACNKVAGPLQLGIAVDGKCGQRTIDAINQANPHDLLLQIKSIAADFYKDWAFRNSKPESELNALLMRVNS